MAEGREQHQQTETSQGQGGLRLPRLPTVEQPMLLLRWLALLLVLILHLFDLSTAGVLVPLPQMVLAVAGYNAVLLLLMRVVPWLQRPLNPLALDTVVATAAVFVTGGYHSSFFVLYVFIVIGAAFQLELVRTIIVTLAIGLIYVGACYVNPASLQSPYAQYILAAKLLLLLVVAVLCGLLLEQLRREHRETERERALAQQLRTLNDLFQRLNTTLSLDLTLQMVAEAPRTLMGADLTSIALLDEDGEHVSIVAAAGIDIRPLAEMRWPVDDELIAAVLSSSQPYVVDRPERYLSYLPPDLVLPQIPPQVISAVSVPLLLNDKPLGVLDVVYAHAQPFAQEDLAFLQALGQEAALAIRNARLYEREREQVGRLRALDELQESFVSSVSHELRTPLTCIRTSVDLLRETSDQLSSDQGELIHTIGHHVARLEALVTDLLEITKLEAGQVTLSTQRTDVRRLVNRVVESLRPLTDHKDQVVQVHCPGTVSRVAVDRRRFEQILTNILSNACKFTQKQGRIDVQVAETPDELQVCVMDNGPGIPEEDLTHVFDRFYVVTDGRGLTGVGLGLSIARQLVELHGGRIWAKSRPGEGSTFCFAIPKTVQVEESRVPGSSEPPLEHLEPLGEGQG